MSCQSLIPFIQGCAAAATLVSVATVALWVTDGRSTSLHVTSSTANPLTVISSSLGHHATVAPAAYPLPSARLNMRAAPVASQSGPEAYVPTAYTAPWPAVLLGLLAGVVLYAARQWQSSHVSEVRPFAMLATGEGHGHGHGHGGPKTVDPNSFVQTAMRTAAMKLHTRDQAKEGEQEAQKPITQWAPTRLQLLQFLVDSRVVHQALDDAVLTRPEFADLRATGLERVPSLNQDIERLLTEDSSLVLPTPSAPVVEYAQQLVAMAQSKGPAFVCHYYNTHFAHTAGGQMIGRSLSNKLMEGRPLYFYQWDGDVQELLAKVRGTIDGMAAKWTEEEKQQCVDETAAAFRAGGAVLQSLK